MDGRSLFLVALIGFIVVVGIVVFYVRGRTASRPSESIDKELATRSEPPAQPSSTLPIPPQPATVLPPPPLPLPSPPSASTEVDDALPQIDRSSDAKKEVLDEAAPESGAEPVETSESSASAEPVRFSAWYPKEAAPHVWIPLRAYVFRLNAADAVTADAAQSLDKQLDEYRPVTGDSLTPLSEGALITATPELPGFQFNPPSASVAFYEDWHSLPFKLRATDAPEEQASNGRITFTVEGVIVADLLMSIFVTATATSAVTAPASAAADPYDAVFCSYSHKDTAIVERLERAYKALGFEYLRDVTTLRSGEEWNARLLALIDEADIFQLFWSNSAATSKYVQQEWEYALSLGRSGAFIRPVYWEQPMPKTPEALGKLHFHYDAALTDSR